MYFQDWNDFLNGFTNVQFCMVTNNSTALSGDQDSGHIGEAPIKEVLSNVHSKLKGDDTLQTSTTPTNNDRV